MKTWTKTWALFVALVSTLALPAAAIGPNGTQGSITAQNANVSSGTATTGSTVAMRLDIPKSGTSMYTGAPSHYGTLGIQVSGTFTGTLTFQASKDFGATWVSWYVVPAVAGTGATGAQVTTTTAVGKWSAGVADVTDFRVTCTAYTNGTATVTMNANTTAQVVIVQSMPPMTAGTAALGEVTAVGKAADGAAATGNPVLIAGSDTTNAQTLLVDTSGRPMVVGAAADGATIAGAPVAIGVKAVASGSAPTQVTTGQAAYPIATLDRIPYVAAYHPNMINCNVAVSTATSLTAVGGSCAAPGASLSIYVTDIHFAASVDSDVTTADALPTLKYGTGGTCGSGTAVFWSAGSLAKTTVSQHLRTPIKIPANNEICWIHSVAGSKVLGIQGFIAP